MSTQTIRPVLRTLALVSLLAAMAVLLGGCCWDWGYCGGGGGGWHGGHCH